MKGAIFVAFERYLEGRIGEIGVEELYDNLAFEADAPPWVGPDSYPDADLLRWVQAVAARLDTPAADVLRAYGRFLMGFLADAHPIFLVDIETPIEMLEQVEAVIHVEVKKLLQDAHPPAIELRRDDAESGTLIYRSPRKLCVLLEGLLQGLAERFGRRVTYRHTRCMNDDADTCELKVRFHD